MAYFRTIAEFVVLAAPMVVAGRGNPVDCHSHPMTDVTIPVTALPDPTDGGSADGGTQELVDGCQTTRSDCSPPATVGSPCISSIQGTAPSERCRLWRARRRG